MTKRGTSKEKIYSEVGLESLQDRRWYRKLCVLYEILNSMSPKYFDINASTTTRYVSSNANSISLLRVNNNYFMNTSLAIVEWNKLDVSIQNSTSLKRQINTICKTFRNQYYALKSVYTCRTSIGIKCLTRLKLRFSHLHYHKFKDGFHDVVDPLWSCSTSITVHKLHCANFSTAQNTYLDEIAGIVR